MPLLFGERKVGTQVRARLLPEGLGVPARRAGGVRGCPRRRGRFPERRAGEEARAWCALRVRAEHRQLLLDSLHQEAPGGSAAAPRGLKLRGPDSPPPPSSLPAAQLPVPGRRESVRQSCSLCEPGR